MRYALALVLVMVPPTATAQNATFTPRTSKLIISPAAIAAGMAATPPAQVNQRRDSVKNGAIIGAVVGAAIMGGFVTFLCNALQEPSDPSCLGSSLVAIGIGAGSGALGGAGVDALMTRPIGGPSTRMSSSFAGRPLAQDIRPVRVP